MHAHDLRFSFVVSSPLVSLLLSCCIETLSAVRQQEPAGKGATRQDLQRRAKQFVQSKGATGNARPAKSAAEVQAERALIEQYLHVLGTLGVGQLACDLFGCFVVQVLSCLSGS